MKFIVSSMLIALLAGRLCAAGVDVSKLPPAVERPVDFVKEVQPLLREALHQVPRAGEAEERLPRGFEGERAQGRRRARAEYRAGKERGEPAHPVRRRAR
jgi:hypothetical protein